MKHNLYKENETKEQMLAIANEIDEFLFPSERGAVQAVCRLGGTVHAMREPFAVAVLGYYKHWAFQKYGDTDAESMAKIYDEAGVSYQISEKWGQKFIEVT